MNLHNDIGFELNKLVVCVEKLTPYRYNVSITVPSI